MNKPTKAQIAAIIRIRDFQGGAAQFPYGVSGTMRDRMQRAGWITHSCDAGYVLTEAGRIVLAECTLQTAMAEAARLYKNDWKP